jgi:hypothetical protein
MSNRHKYFRNDVEIPAADALDQRGLLRDGCTCRVPTTVRDHDPHLWADAEHRRPVFDAFGDPAGYRPGAVFSNDQAARDAKAAAYKDYDDAIGQAWQNDRKVKKYNSHGELENTFEEEDTCDSSKSLADRMRDHRQLMDKLVAERDAETTDMWRLK